jgi:hypothetical protein
MNRDSVIMTQARTRMPVGLRVTSPRLTRSPTQAASHGAGLGLQRSVTRTRSLGPSRSRVCARRRVTRTVSRSRSEVRVWAGPRAGCHGAARLGRIRPGASQRLGIPESQPGRARACRLSAAETAAAASAGWFKADSESAPGPVMVATMTAPTPAAEATYH